MSHWRVGVIVCVVVAGSLSGTAVAATKEFCATYKKFNLLYGAQFNAGTPTPEQIAAVQPRFDKLADSLATAVPAAIDDDVKVVADKFRSGFKNVVGDINDQAFADALDAADQWAIKHCGYKVVNVTATDFAFTGLPKTLKPGFVAFNVKNDATQSHLFAIVRAKGNETAEELAALPLDQAIQRVEVIASSVLAEPGKLVVNYAQFTKPGRYGAVDPNFIVQNMYAQFTVKKA